MSITLRKFITKVLAEGEFSNALRFVVNHSSSEPEPIRILIARELPDGAKEVRDNFTYEDLVSIYDLKNDFYVLLLQFKDSNKADIEVEFSTLGSNDDVFTVKVISEEDEIIKTFFELLTAKLKLESPKPASVVNDAIALPSNNDLASRSYEYRHAILIKPDDIEYLGKFLTSNFEVIRYVARCIDDTKIPFASVEEILDYENFTFKRMVKLEIEAHSRGISGTSLELKIGEDVSFLFVSTVQFILKYKDLSWGMKTEQELIGRIKELRPWYWWLKKSVSYFCFAVLVSFTTPITKLGFFDPETRRYFCATS